MAIALLNPVTRVVKSCVIYPGGAGFVREITFADGKKQEDEFEKLSSAKRDFAMKFQGIKHNLPRPVWGEVSA